MKPLAVLMAFTICLGIALVASCQLYRFAARAGHDFRQYDLNENLIMAATGGDTRKVTTLVRHGASLNFSDNCSGLEAAIQNGYPQTVKLLVKLGAKVDDGRDGFDTPLMAANDAEIAEYLLDHGARINARDSMGMTALMQAAQHGDAKVVRVLIRRGADVNAQSGDHRTALDLAVEMAHKNGAEYLQTVQVLRDAGSVTARK